MKKARAEDVEEVGCAGLLRGFARHLQTGNLWSALDATKGDGPFYCPVCYSDAVVRKCSEKRDHFAHGGRLSPTLSASESELHEACKNEICAALTAALPSGKWAVEREIRQSADGRIPKSKPDISGRMAGNEPVAVEVQVSALTIPKIIQRTAVYAQRGISLVWVVPLREPLGGDPFRPRLYERYFHSIFWGRVYYWWPGMGATVQPVHYGPTSRRIPYSEWREDGEEMSAGGYMKRYKTIKLPVYGPILHLAHDFHSILRDAFIPENERKQVPSCNIWHDTLMPWWASNAVDITPPEFGSE